MCSTMQSRTSKNLKEERDDAGNPIKVCQFRATKKKPGKEATEVTVGMCQAFLDSIAACNRVGLETWLGSWPPDFRQRQGHQGVHAPWGPQSCGLSVARE